jgi:N-sulfoglucosamine sulfohydrolase
MLSTQVFLLRMKLSSITRQIRLSRLVAVALALLPAMAASGRPNILLIVSEDNGPHLGCYGDPFAQTPVLDEMASEGILFTRAYVSQAGCSPSRASIYTGLYPHQNGQLGLATWGFRLYRDDMPNLVTSLKKAGYRTGIIGKLHINPKESFPFDFVAITSGNFKRRNLPAYAEEANRFFKAGEEPFFLSVNYPEAHQPWYRQVDGIPESPIGAEEVDSLPQLGLGRGPEDVREIVADYYNCMARLDYLVGELLAELESSGLADNTLVVYLGDHGADMLRGKRTCYEGGVHVPLIMRWPSGADAGLRSSELVSLVDLMPTFLELGRAESPGNLAGKSMVPLLRSGPANWREYLFTEYHTHAGRDNFYPQRAVRNERYKLIENLFPGEVNAGHAFMMNHTDADFISAVAAAPPHVKAAYKRMEIPSRWELYDLSTDPFEFVDLSTDDGYAEILSELQSVLMTWREKTMDPLLDETALNLFKEEVLSVPDKQHARNKNWQYPDYLLNQ